MFSSPRNSLGTEKKIEENHGKPENFVATKNMFCFGKKSIEVGSVGFG